jgi:hypothetical protein
MNDMLKRLSCFLICFVFAFSFFSFTQPASARTTTLPGGLNELDAPLQEAINQAAPGDTILIPAGEYIIKRPVAVNKPLIIKGEGVVNTKISHGTNVLFAVHADNVRIEGIEFIGRPNISGDRAIDVYDAKDFCIIRCHFNNISRAGVVVNGDARGVISKCNFFDIWDGSGVVVYGNGETSWEEPLVFGTENAVFVEDCEFYRNWHAIGSNEGSKYVFRYNEVYDCLKEAQAVDAHGYEYQSSCGSRSFEVYHNTISNASACYAGIWIRGGDGLVFNNNIYNCTNAVLLSVTTSAPEDPDDEDYPFKDQTMLMYAWSNTLNNQPVGINVRSDSVFFLQEGRNFFNENYFDVNEEYQPYPYPHPLTLDEAWEAPEPVVWTSSSSFSDGVYTLGSGNTDTLLVKFDIEHGPLASECIVGYANSDATVVDDQSLFAKIRAFNGTISVSDGVYYQALETVSYEVYSRSFVKMYIDFDNSTYDVWITPEGGNETLIADDFALGSGASDLGQICLKSDDAGDFSVIEHSVISYVQPVQIISDKYSASGFTRVVDGVTVEREEGLITISPAVDGLVSIEFDFVPYAYNIDGVLGFAGADRFISEYGSFSFMFRASVNGYFDAYNSTVYTYTTKIEYEANTIYHVKILVDVGAAKYDVWVTPEGSEEIQLADDFGFRAATPTIYEIGKAFLRSKNDEDFGIIDFTATKIGEGTPPGPTATPVPTEPPVSTLISDLVVNDTSNANNWSIQTNLQEDDKQYGDRNYTLEEIPNALRGLDWIRTANNSKGYTSNPEVATFKVLSNAYVYVAYHDDIPNKWISSGWKDTGMNIVNSEPETYSVYRRFYPAGSTVTLGYNGTSDHGNYFVIVKERVLIDELDVKDTNNAGAWSIQTNLQAGDKQYGDRTFLLTSVPPIVAGCDWIRTANSSKGYSGDPPVATFKVVADSYVYVAYNVRIEPGQRWITSEWEDTGEDITNNEGTPAVYRLYRKYFPADSVVSLGPNGTSVEGNYFVIVDEVDRIELGQVNDMEIKVGESVTIGLNPNVTGTVINAQYNDTVIDAEVDGDSLTITGVSEGQTVVEVTSSHADYCSGTALFNVKVEAEDAGETTPTPTPTPTPEPTPTPTPDSETTPTPTSDSETTPTPTSIQTPSKPPVQSVNSKGEIEITVSEAIEGEFNVEVSSGVLKGAIDAATESGNKTLTVKMTNTEDAVKVNTVLPASVFEEAESAGIERLEIDTGIAKISVASDAFGDEISTANKSVEISVEQVDKETLPEGIASIVGDKPVYDFNAFIDGQKISQFYGEKPIQITLRYELKEGEDPHKIVIYHIKDDGSLEVITNTKYNEEDGTVTFYLNSFSKYVPLHVDVAFKDTVNAAWAKEYIEAVAAREIMKGSNDGYFHPNEYVTREEFVRILVEALGLTDENASCNFSDVAKGSQYYKYIASAQKLGITNGIGGNKFGMSRNISRQDMAVMACRALKAMGIEIAGVNEAEDFLDTENIASYAREAVKAMRAAGIISGVGGNKYVPDANCTKAQIAKIVYLLLMQT